MQTKINYSLDNIQRAYDSIGPYDFKTIHIAGTNGKGSVCTFLELLYLTCLPNLKVGKYTSPHIWSVTERFSVQGVDISSSKFEAQSSKLRSRIQSFEHLTSSFQLSKFEELTLLAFEYFNEEQVDVAILETGLGGRFDATNVIPIENRLATAITNVAMDHMDYLGDSIEKIRKEKEGICRNGVPHFDGSSVFAKATPRPGLEAGGSKPFPNSARGVNFLLALEIFESINQLQVGEEEKQEVLKQFPLRHRARFEYKDRVLFDVAHNPAGMRILNEFICGLPEFNRKIFVLAFLDKDYKSCLEELFANGVMDPDRDLVILTEIDSSRATPSFLLDEIIDANKMLITDPQEAIATALDLKKENDLVVITGSFRLVACF